MPAFKCILAVITGAEADQSVLDSALGFGRRFDAHIDVLHARGDPRDAVPFLGEGASGALIEQIMSTAQREAETRAQRAKQTFESWCSKHAISLVDRPPGPTQMSARFREETGREDELVSKLGRLVDLIVIARPAAENAAASPVTFEAALLDTGRAVLATPPTMSAEAIDRIASGATMIAWNGSAQAARAVSAARRILETAGEVRVVSSAEGDMSAAATAGLVEFLAWHGIQARSATLSGKTPSVGAVLLADAEANNVGLLVMGAYTHSRLRHMVFGGATSHVLAHAKLPVFMAH